MYVCMYHLQRKIHEFSVSRSIPESRLASLNILTLSSTTKVPTVASNYVDLIFP